MADDGRSYAYGAPALSPFDAEQFPVVKGMLYQPTSAGTFKLDTRGYVDTANAYNKRVGELADINAARKAEFDALVAAITAGQKSGGGSGVNRAGFRTGAQLLSRLRGSDPFKNLEAALMKARTGAESTGADAISRLRSALEARTNPYQGVQFNTPVAAANPLADYMSASGVSTGQVDALRALLGSLSANAATADQQMADRMSTSWTNDQQSRLADASTSEAAFKQALAQSYAQQEAQLALMRQQRQDALTDQLVQLAVQSGMTPEQLGVTI